MGVPVPGPVSEPMIAVSSTGAQQTVDTGAHECWPSLGLPCTFCGHFLQPSQALGHLPKKMWGFSHAQEEKQEIAGEGPCRQWE